MTTTPSSSFFTRFGVIPALFLIGLLSSCGDQQEKQELQEHIELLQGKLDEKTQELETLDNSFEEIGSYLDSIRAEERNVRAGMERGRKRNKAELMEQMGRLGSYIDSLNNRILFLETRLRNSEANSNRYAGLEKMISTLRMQLTEKEEEIAGLRKEVNNLQGMVADANIRIREKESTIAEQQGQIASKAQQLDETAKQAQAAREEAIRAHTVNVKNLLDEANQEYDKAKKRGGLFAARKAQKAEYQAALTKYQAALELIKTHQLKEFSISQTEQRIQEIKNNLKD